MHDPKSDRGTRTEESDVTSDSLPVSDDSAGDEGIDDSEPKDIPEQKIPGKPISDMDPPGQGAPEGDQSAERQREVSGNDPAKLGKTGG